VNDAHFGLIYWAGLPPTVGFLVGLAGLDLFAYFAHVSMHKLHTLWRFHRVHHADSRVNVTTAFREHPGETVWRISWHLAAVVVFGIPPWLLLIYLTISAFNAQLEHCNLKVPAKIDRWLRLIYVTPNMHKLHHHRYLPETDMNYSNLLSIWDRLFMTYHPGPNFHHLNYGLDDFDWESRNSVKELLFAPFTIPYRPPTTPIGHDAGTRNNPG
jgi:sterol desaturase/sphingolipid hydroxylase (fatty acid hydroxylase superfamily)